MATSSWPLVLVLRNKQYDPFKYKKLGEIETLVIQSARRIELLVSRLESQASRPRTLETLNRIKELSKTIQQVCDYPGLGE